MSTTPRRILALALLLLFLGVTSVHGQGLSPVVTASVGVSDPGLGRLSSTPRAVLQVSQVFFTDDDARFSLGVGLFWGFWAGAEEGSCEDCHIYSYRSQDVGARVRLAPSVRQVSLAFEAGIARRFVWARYERGANLFGNPGEDYRTAYPTAEAGLDLTVPVSTRIAVGAGVRGSVPLVFDETQRGVQFGVRAAGSVLVRYRL